MDHATLRVPMLDLKAQYLQVKDEIDEAIQRVIESQHFINGPDVASFEKELACYGRVRDCIGVSSGSDALLLALMALDVKFGDEVITTPYTFFATAGAIARLGARPIFVDIDPATFNINPDLIESRVSKRTKAIMPVHLFGQCADMDPILDIAKRHGLAVIEDAAQAIGAEYKGRRAGTMGTIGCFSFFPSKNLGAFGDGGAIVTNDSALAEKMRVLRNHGSNPKYYHKMIGGNFRLDTIQAAILQVKLSRLDGWTARRQQNAAFYEAAFARAGLRGGKVQTPKAQPGHIFNQYVVRVDDREGVKDYLKKQHIGTEVYYPVPMHLQECFADLGYKKGAFPESEKAAQSSLALPIYPELTAAQKQRVVDSITAYYHQAASMHRAKAA